MLYPAELHPPQELSLLHSVGFHQTLHRAVFFRETLEQALEGHGVGDGIRTRDVQIHSLALYQLSYTHRVAVLRQRSSVFPL